MSFFFKALLTGQPQDSDTIKVYAAGTTDLITGLTGIDDLALANPFLVSAAGGVGEWGFNAPNQIDYDVWWEEGAALISESQREIDGSYFDLTTRLSVPSRKEGRLYYDNVNQCMSFFNAQSEFTWQISREVPMLVWNDSATETLLDGRAIAVIDVGTPPAGPKVVPFVGYASANFALGIAQNTIGIATQDIEPKSYGEVTIIGFVNDVNTDHLISGKIMWLADTNPATGLMTSTKVTSPAWVIEMGGVLIKDAVAGVLWANMIPRGNTGDVLKIFNGAILEHHTIAITSDGLTITLTLDNAEDNLSLFYDANFSQISIPTSVALTEGTDALPVLNYVYIPRSTKTLTISAIGFPEGEQFTPVATVLCQSAISIQDDQPYKVHAWTDHLADVVGQGHLSNINKWIRLQNATWIDGILPTISGSGTGTIGVSTTQGNILQLHEHIMPSFADPAELYMINDFITAYQKYTNLLNITADSLGGSLANKTFALVLWGVASENSNDCKLFLTIPSGSYSGNKPDDVVTDLEKYTNYSIPDEYKGTAFLIRRIIAYKNAGETLLTIFDRDGDDLRGTFPNVSAGGGALPSGASGTFTTTDAKTVTVLNGIITSIV